MTRQDRMRVLFPLLMIGAQGVWAQDPAGEMRPEPRAVESTPAAWAIAPPGTRMPEGSRIPEDVVLPDGTVLQEAVTLPAGTILPGGAILPKTAAPEAAPAQVPSAPTEPEESEVASGVPYISGGIGASGREEMQELKSKFNLRLLFAIQGSGEYLADVKVRIDDASGPTLLTAVSQGPWFYASLAPGRYRLTVDNAGQIQTREVTVPEGRATEQSFYWAP
ncbi:carboxypeptidase-like regulatory domain-containing protein [Thiorhodococcus fuscus]|uniref:Carboxypeptidase-like regulatory domain-containing protein n=1 Tax=Thiorhodococcus fuscus TaxID=527200 RepID=A0ABW4YC66_9GAMM